VEIVADEPMADEPTAQDPKPTTDGVNIAEEVTGTFAKLQGGDRWAVLGASIVLVGAAIFDLILDQYRTGHAPVVLAMLAAGAAYFHHTKGRDLAIPYRSLVFVAAGLLGLLGAWDFIEEVRNGIFDGGDGATIIGALVYYVGSIMSGVGALMINK
jgi:hypothetical protein